MLKKVGIVSLLVLIILNSFSFTAFADTYTLFHIKGYYDYIGNIGKYNITLSIYYDESKFIGTYIYDKYRKEIVIDGKIDHTNKITLREYDNKHNVTATFVGTLNKDDSITGIWEDKSKTKKYKFKLKLRDIVPAREYGHRYDIAAFDNDADVIEYVERFQEYVKNDDVSNISKLIFYTITVTINGKYVNLSKVQFIKNYKKIFTTEFKNILTKAFAPYLFATWEGVMVSPVGEGNKNIWINNSLDDSGIFITEIYN